MGKLIDLTGQRFSKLVVVERAGKDKNGQIQWLCRCDCGVFVSVNSANLRKGHTKSCGCLKSEVATINHTTHNLYHTRLHKIWTNMKTRCYNPNVKNYYRYGGRGITICDEWKQDFKAFYDWAMANGYRDDLSIDRIDNNNGYSPDNCRWATAIVQGNNNSRNLKVIINGEEKTLADWCRCYKVGYKNVHKRIHLKGWTPEEALELVPRKK